MKMSDERKMKLYSAISDPIMDLRVAVRMNNVKDIDDELFRVTSKIWLSVGRTLGIKDK